MTAISTPVGVQLLEQAAIWRAWDHTAGRLVDLSLEDMTPGHRVEVLAYLRRDPDRVLLRAMDELTRLQRAGLVGDDEFRDRSVALAAAVWSPEVWLESRPLVRRLVQLAPLWRRVAWRWARARARHS